MQIQDFSHHLKGLEEELQRQLSRDLPEKIGNLAVRMFKENFQKESFFGRAWQEVKRRIQGAKGAAGKRKILAGPTGNLRRSIQFIPRDGSVTVESDLPYSSAHNEGTNNAGRSRNVRIPQRQFIGESPELTAAIEKKITEEISKALNK
ncbi:MAG: phage virion morphogenesis protein [Bacteroidales bacterium]|nr:phage virion morphogenesis protein [Bacteroidales bacterium]